MNYGFTLDFLGKARILELEHWRHKIFDQSIYLG